MDVNACDKCGKTAPLQILNTHRFGICVGCGFPIVRGDEFDNARLEAVQGDECHLNMPQRIHEQRVFRKGPIPEFKYEVADNTYVHDLCEKMGTTFAELMEQQRWPWSLPNRPDFKDAGTAYPKGYDKNGPFFQFKSKPPPEGYHFQNVFPTLDTFRESFKEAVESQPNVLDLNPSVNVKHNLKINENIVKFFRKFKWVNKDSYGK